MPTSVVVPVYNSEATLLPLSERIAAALGNNSEDHELILVDDGSQDGSWLVITALAARDRRISGIRLMRNYGQHNALLCGIRAARHPIVVTLDDDLQHPPEEIPKLLEKLQQGCDVVYGTPRTPEHGLWRNLATRTTKLVLQSTMGATSARQVSAFRAFRTGLREAFRSYRGPFVSIDVLLTWATTRFAAVPVEHAPRMAGRSKYTLAKLVRHAMNLMTGFSTLPLQLASLMGFAFTLFGGLVLVFVVSRYLIQGGSVPGFPFLASIISIFSGAQLFALGIIGEYLARMHFRMMDRPAYSVGESTRGGSGE